MPRFSFAAAIAAMVVAAPLAAQTVSFTQSDFADLSGWSRAGNGNEFFSVSAIPTGGNGGSYLRHTLNSNGRFLSSSVSAVQAFFNPTWSFNPTMLGALDRVEFEFDLAGGGAFFRPLIRQGSSLFRLNPSSQNTATTWRSFLLSSSSSAVNWTLIGGSGTLDWSATAATMEFGWLYSLQFVCGAGVTCSSTVDNTGFDNFAVRAYAVRPPATVPEPASAALVMAGLLGLAIARHGKHRASRTHE